MRSGILNALPFREFSTNFFRRSRLLKRCSVPRERLTVIAFIFVAFTDLFIIILVVCKKNKKLGYFANWVVNEMCEATFGAKTIDAFEMEFLTRQNQNVTIGTKKCAPIKYNFGWCEIWEYSECGPGWLVSDWDKRCVFIRRPLLFDVFTCLLIGDFVENIFEWTLSRLWTISVAFETGIPREMHRYQKTPLCFIDFSHCLRHAAVIANEHYLNIHELLWCLLWNIPTTS